MMFQLSGKPRPIIVYPFESTSYNREILNRNPPAIMNLVRPNFGPDGRRYGSFELEGNPASSIRIRNLGRLDVMKSMTISIWIYPKGPGPILHYDPTGDGVSIWFVAPHILKVQYVTRSTRRPLPYLAGKIKRWRWNYISTTYDKKSGVAALYINRRLVSKRKIGRADMATNYPVIIGSKPGSKDSYRGRISCLQLYDYALTHREVYSVRKRCFGTSKYIRSVCRFVSSSTVNQAANGNLCYVKQHLLLRKRKQNN